MQKKEELLLEEVFATVAHQWRQPLSKINSLVGAIDNKLYEEGVENSFVHDKLFEIEKVTKEMSVIIDDFRAYFSKKKDTIYFQEVVDLLYDALTINLDSLGIKLKVFVGENAHFYGDKQLLKQVLVTLVSNARDALIERNVYDAEISLHAEMQGKELFIKVCDNAGGISKSMQKRIFEHDFSTKHSSEGSGLGLFMVKKLLEEKLQATIEVKNVDKGSCFTIMIEDKNNG